MAYLHTDVLDLGLTEITKITDLHICSGEPATYADVATLSIGIKTSPLVGPVAGLPEGYGRGVTLSGITDGEGTAAGTATHWAVIDSGTSRLLAAKSLFVPVNVADGNIFTLTEFTIGIPFPL